MITLNTNLSSMIVQSNLTTSTKGLNQAIERMTTGFKINNAKDNAANYSISTSLASKLSSYNVAQDNVAMGLDMLITAEDSLSLISNHLSRIRDLTEQAANGTYGASSLSAIQSEINARLAECARIHSNTEYNGIKLFEDNSASESLDGPVAQYDGFIEEVQQLTEEEAIAQGYTVIKTADELQAMENDLNGKYILMNDIDLVGYDWEPVGASESNSFAGELNGNGYVIKNLTISNPNKDFQGLFGFIYYATVQNLGLENVNIEGGDYVGALAGATSRYGQNLYSTITNCYSSGNVSGDVSAGGLIGTFAGNMANCYSSADIQGDSMVGGLIGDCEDSIFTSCNTTGNVTATGNSIGGLIGYVSWECSLIDCYTTGDIYGKDWIGGLIGASYDSSHITNSFVSGDITGSSCTGGLIGMLQYDGDISDSYFGGIVTGQDKTSTGVLIGEFRSDYGASQTLTLTLTNCTYYSSLNPGIAIIGHDIYNTDLSGLIDGGTPPSESSGINFQAGIHSDKSSQISLSLGFNFSLTIDVSTSYAARNALEQIDEILSQISAKQTEYGAAYNRMESALESIGVSIDNLTSTQSTIRDADIAEVSSEYIQMQILQQASATLLATANQTPSIALQLL